ncbi:MAG: V-type ATP synthase subunit I [Bacilli bacterium]|nr:V-type ATP synthase subunit I [Bacilli bacterium]MBN2696368.1 V-type ATP synthase subunit I [Bacilli bacterium]
MAIAKTKLVNITARLLDMDAVLEKFVDLHCFHPVASGQFVDRVHGLTSFSSENPCSIILNELVEIEREFGFCIPVVEVKTADHTLDKMRTYVSTTHSKLKSLVMQKKEIQELIKKYEDAEVQVRNIEEMDISLDDVFSCSYVYARVGRLPTESVEKLSYYRSRPFIFNSFTVDKNYSWCIYFTSHEYEREVDNIFSSLFFERIHIPDYVHGTPEDATVTLAKEIEVATKEMDKLQENINSVLAETNDELRNIKSELTFLNRIHEARQYVVGLGEKFTITGFVEEKDENLIVEKFEGMSNVEVSLRPADSDRRLKPPTKLKHGWFSRPFSMFVEMYGLPSYGDVDPTPFVAITYSLLFGIMFGDVGQGLLLALIGFGLYKWKKMKLGEIAIRIGLFSTLFGFLYGSVFGNEELLDPFYINVLGLSGKPIHVMDSDFTMTLLILAVLIGAMLILMSIAINISIKFKKKQYAEMVLSHNGIAGMIFYLFIGGGLIAQMMYQIKVFNTLTIILFAVIPLLLVFLKEPLERKLHGHKMFPNGFGGFFTEGFFELFEVVLSYITNTMSFMRVGGFVLSHAGMMLVVYSLMSMGGSAFSTALIFVIGNLFVMAIEGLIVGIQVLRLEFYEMFSRYYEGNGIAFQTFS